jgi:hypothetical protein
LLQQQKYTKARNFQTLLLNSPKIFKWNSSINSSLVHYCSCYLQWLPFILFVVWDIEKLLFIG